MRILSVQAHAFGPIADGELHFGPGLTVVCGGNETGKSSWHAATTTALAGRRRGRARKIDPDISRYRPWEGEAWAVSCVVELADGREIRLIHQLAAGRSQAIDNRTGADLTAELSNDGGVDASTLLGLNRMTLPLVASVRQSEILALSVAQADDDAVRSLRGMLQKAVSSRSSTDATAEQAISRLTSFAKQTIGTERAGSHKPLRQAKEAHAAAVAAEAEARDAWRLHRTNGDALSRSQAEVAQLRDRVAELTVAEAARAAVAAREKYQAAARLHAQAARSGEPSDPDLARRVQQVMAAIGQCPPVPAAPARSSALLAEMLDDLPLAPTGHVSPEPEVEQLAARFEAAVHAEQAHVASGRPPAAIESDAVAAADLISAAELRDAAASLDQPVPPPPAVAGIPGAALVVLLATATVAMGTGAVVGSPALVIFGAVFLLTAAIGAWVRTHPSSEPDGTAQRTRAALCDHLEAIGLTPDPQVLRERAAAMDGAALAEKAAQEWERTRARRRSAVEGLAAELGARLDEVGCPPHDRSSDALRVGLIEYRAACADRAAQRAEAMRRDDLTRQLHAAQELEQRIDEARAQRSKVAGTIAQLAGSLGLGADVDALETGEAALWASVYEELGRWLAVDGERAAAETAAEHAATALELLLDGYSLEELGAEADRKLAEVAAPGGAAERLAVAADPILRGRMEDELAAADRVAQQLQGTVREAERTLVGLAEIAEEVRRTATAYQRLQRLDRLVGATVSALTEARQEVHRDIAPLIARATSDGLARISAGRYKRVRVDPEDLSVQVELADGTSRPAEHLSHGTAEQIYLLARAAIAETVAGDAESCPLLLDDVTVHADADRTEAVLQLLLDLSVDRQIVLFSQEDAVRNWAEEVGATVLVLPGV